MDGSRGSCQTRVSFWGQVGGTEKDLSRLPVFGKLREDRQDKPTVLGTSTFNNSEICFFFLNGESRNRSREIVLEREINKT